MYLLSLDFLTYQMLYKKVQLIVTTVNIFKMSSLAGEVAETIYSFNLMCKNCYE